MFPQPLDPPSRSGANASKSDDDARERLIQCIQLAPDREWMEQYFDLANEMIEATRLEDGDPRLAMTIRSTFLPVSINRRYVLSALRKKLKAVEFIVGSDYPELSWLQINCSRWGQFDSHRKSEQDPPYLFAVEKRPHLILDGKLKQSWLEACHYEISNGEVSPYRRYHQPIVYRATVDKSFRNNLFDEAFSRIR